VGDPDEASSPDSSAGHGARRHRLGPLPPPVLELFLRVAVVGDGVDEHPVEAIDAFMRGAAQSDGIADDGVKYGCTSVWDWLITRRISAVVVCRSSASVRS